MATINVKTTVTAPTEVNVPLVRADYAETANIFRVCFEVFLSIFASLMGFILGQTKISNFHWLSLVVTGISALVFAWISFVYSRKAHKV